MRVFYEKAFGWQTRQLGPDMGDYVLATTAPTDEQNMVLRPGTINGGFFQKTQDPVSQYPSVVIQVADLAASMRRVEEAGGRISGPVQDMPQIGRFVSFIDTEGNRLSLMQPKSPVA
jgi:predicted enzyme related to lactoylglutathione lyase